MNILPHEQAQLSCIMTQPCLMCRLGDLRSELADIYIGRLAFWCVFLSVHLLQCLYLPNLITPKVLQSVGSRTEREEIHDDVFCIVHIFPFFALDGALLRQRSFLIANVE